MNSSRALYKISSMILNPSMIPFVINMMNIVDSLPTILLMELLMEFIPSVILLVIMARHHFFGFVLIIFFPTIIPSVNTEGIFSSVKSVGNLPIKIYSQYFCLYLSIFW